MNNIELYGRFSAIERKNCFDQVQDLRKFAKEYKMSDFYKATKMPLKKAYSLFLTSTGSSVAAKLDVIMDKDYIVEYLKALFDEGKIQEAMEQVVSKMMSDYNPEELAELKEQTRSIMERLNII